MRLRTAAFVTGAALALAAFPLAAHAFGRPGHGLGPDGPGRILHMAKELGLSDAQTAQIETIAEKHKDGALGDSMQSMRQARETLRATIHDATATDDQVRDAAAAVATLETQAAVQRHQMAIEISKILTPEQKAKLAERMANAEDERRGPPCGGHGGDGGHGGHRGF